MVTCVKVETRFLERIGWEGWTRKHSVIHIENPLDLVAINKIRVTSMVSEHWYVSANVLNLNIIEVISLRVFIFIFVCPFVAFSSLFSLSYVFYMVINPGHSVSSVYGGFVMLFRSVGMDGCVPRLKFIYCCFIYSFL